MENIKIHFHLEGASMPYTYCGLSGQAGDRYTANWQEVTCSWCETMELMDSAIVMRGKSSARHFLRRIFADA